jgi:hypothetical protein
MSAWGIAGKSSRELERLLRQASCAKGEIDKAELEEKRRLIL